ncbi:MAG: phosphoribosylglycinamide formyltransferase [Gammaproteobacteria bacterium]|nr:phosphoribosylglycinamide formyltransferase [Gammaproteobacteria bacterium]
MSSYSLVVLISGNGSNLQAIIDQIERGYLNAKIECVISNKKGAYGLERAQKHNIPTAELEHQAFSSREAYDHELIKLIKPHQPDCIVLAGFMRILTASFFNAFEHKIINIHPSLLPKYQGLRTHQRALENKDADHGISVHIATEELDSGPVIAQADFPIEAKDTIEDLQKKCHQLEHILYPLVLKWLIEKKVEISTGIITFNQSILKQPLMLKQISQNELP